MRRNWWQRFKTSDAHTQANIVCTFLVMLATVAYACIAGCQLRAMNGQLEEMRTTAQQSDRQIGLMQKQIEAGARAWILITDFKPITYKWFPEQVSIYAVASLRNVGNIPATRVYGFAETRMSESLSFAHPELQGFQKEACQRGLVTIGGRPLGRVQTIYPAQDGEDHPVIAASVTVEDAMDHVRKTGHFDPYMLGCVYFQFSTSTTIHEVPFIYRIKRRLPSGQTAYLRPGEDVPINEILMDREVNGDAVTDNP